MRMQMSEHEGDWRRWFSSSSGSTHTLYKSQWSPAQIHQSVLSISRNECATNTVLFLVSWETRLTPAPQRRYRNSPHASQSRRLPTVSSSKENSQLLYSEPMLSLPTRFRLRSARSTLLVKRSRVFSAQKFPLRAATPSQPPTSHYYL